jgi:hypothetical protein
MYPAEEPAVRNSIPESVEPSTQSVPRPDTDSVQPVMLARPKAASLNDDENKPPESIAPAFITGALLNVCVPLQVGEKA